MPLLDGARLVTPDGVLDPGWIELDGDRIVGLGPGAAPRAPDEQLDRALVVPGFVDLHVHGAAKAAYMSGDPEQANAVAALHRQHGTTTTMASLVTGTTAELEHAIGALAELVEDGRLAGIHLEGPYLSEARCGAHDPALLRDPEPASLQRLLDIGRGTVAMVTLAPEREHGLEAIRRVVDAGAISAVGHTDADYDTARAAIEAGVRVGTHLFNAMAPLHHRDPGPIAALLEDSRVAVELVCDGIHLHPATIRLAAQAAGPARVALVTDAMSATGVGDGDYTLGAQAVQVRDGVARLAAGGSIAGSTLTMDAAFAFAVRTGFDLPAAVAASSATPARLLGIDDEVGHLAVGLRADLVMFDRELRLQRVMHRGSWLHPPDPPDEVGSDNLLTRRE
ncbi:MAG TPA: N-acetylglucosamine-6-phosphate deacetylase [Jiangellaceae bacterium]|nr:N-acetylglucosamine-6-phosphate deacetylase [Jiangellaceae bacterium]